MIGVRITNCRGETFCVSTSFFPPSPPLQASHANTQWGQIMQFQSHFCVEHFLATLSDIDLQAICIQFTPRGQLNRQLLEKALLEGELKVHPALALSDLHLGDHSAASNTVYKPNKKAAIQQTEQRSLITVRAEIKTTLRQILDQERFDAQQLEKQYQQQSSYEKSLTHIKQFAKGLHSSGISFLTWLKDVHDVINMNQRLLRIIKAAMAADDGNHGQRYQVFKQTLAESEKKELVEALGFDPAKISVDQLKQVYALANLIYEDLPTRIMLTQFVKDYADAQHSLEWSEFSSGAAFEVILTALLAIATGGVGAIASLGAQARKISQLRKLGALLTELAEGLKNLPKEKPVSLRQMKEIEDKKASKVRPPSEKPAPKSESSSASEKDNVGGMVDDASYRKEKEHVALDRKRLELEPGQKGSWNKALNQQLNANTDYKVGNYIYQTDNAGNVNRVSGNLQLETRDRNTYQQTKSAEVGGIKDGLSTDDGGHLVASIFDGPGEQINYSPMNSNLNRGQWKRMENKWADALNSGKEVSVDIKPIYEGSSKRPSAFKVKYWIDGKTKTAFFENKHGG